MSPTNSKDVRLPGGAEELLRRLSAPDRPDGQWEEQAQAILARTAARDEAAPRSAIRFTAVPLSDDELLAQPFPRLDGEPAEATPPGDTARAPERPRDAVPRLAAIARAVAAQPAGEGGDDLIAESLRLATRRRHVEPLEPPPAWPERKVRAPAADTAEQAAAALQSTVRPPSLRPAAVQLPEPVGAGAAPSKEPAQATPSPSSHLGLGMLLGAGLATAAAAVLYITAQHGPASSPAPGAAPREVSAAHTPQARAAAQPQGAGATAAPDAIITLDDLPSESSTPAPAPPSARGPAPQRSTRPSAPEEAIAGTVATAAPAASPAEPARAAHAAEPAPEPTPAEASEATHPEPEMRPAMLTDLPDKPSVGAVQAAIGTVMGSAQVCVAGHDRGSKVTVVFGSDGRVQRVDVGSPAAGTPAEGCIRTALERARTAPFAQPRFSASVTVRPR